MVCGPHTATELRTGQRWLCDSGPGPRKARVCAASARVQERSKPDERRQADQTHSGSVGMLVGIAGVAKPGTGTEGRTRPEKSTDPTALVVMWMELQALSHVDITARNARLPPVLGKAAEMNISTGT